MNQQKLLKGLVMMLLLLQVLSETYEILLNQQKVLTDFLLIIQTKCLKKTISKSQEFIKNTKNNGKHIVIKKKKKLICISFELFTIT